MLKDNVGDFKYNGIPIFNVGFNDFSYVVNCFENNHKISTRQLNNNNLKDYYKKSKEHALGIIYEGILIDFRDLKYKNSLE